MKVRLFAQLLIGLVFVFANSIATSQTVHNSTYYCDEDRGVPATFVQTSRVPLPIIRWVSVDLPIPPAQRCQSVSRNFQIAHDQGSLRYITTGIMRQQPVVCATSRKGDKCKNLLFELKPGSNPKYILNKLLNRRGLGADNPLNQTGSDPIYLDVEDYLKRLNQQL
jgi:Circadian oscillating protein COP23